MAGTIMLGSFDNDNVQFEMDYDDNLDVLTLRCRNNTDKNAFGLLQRVGEDGEPDGVQYGGEMIAGETTVIAIPQTVHAGIRLVPAAQNGRFMGYLMDARYPF